MSSDRSRASLFLRAGAVVLGLMAFLVAPPPGATQGAAKGLGVSARLPNFDLAREERAATVRTGKAGAAPALAAVGNKVRPIPNTVVRYNELSGLASRVSRAKGTLTGPNKADALEVSRSFVATNPGLYGLSGAEVQALAPLRRITTSGTGVTHLTLGQQFRGIPVFKSWLKADVTAAGELVSTSGSLVPKLAQTINAVAPRLSAQQALRLAAGYAGIGNTALPPPVAAGSDARRTITFGPSRTFSQPPVAQLSLFAVAPTRTVLAWDTTLYLAATGDGYHMLVDATDGRLLFRLNYTSHASGVVYDKEAPTEEFPVESSAPPLLPRVLRPFDGSDQFAGKALFPAADPHFDWWAGGDQNVTSSNNVRTGSARDATTLTLVTTTNALYDFPLDHALEPSTYTSAAAVNLFYWNNRLHDIWYQFGFDEAAGNFQNDTFGRAGAGGDAVLALTQFGADAGFQNNATFGTPPDGTPGTMRMFEFTVTTPRRDSDLTADIIAHEYGHGVSNRLVSNANGLGGFQPVSMGEGWSDFQSLMVLAQPEDNVHAQYPMGGWILNDYDAGVRSQPYSTNVSGAVFTRTFRNISDPIQGAPEVHLAGEIICNTLWQVYGTMRTKLGFDAGRKQTMQLFIDMLKLLPDEPTFLDCRDKLLLADQLRYGGVHVSDIWAAFASRGMGYSASTTGPDDLAPVEAFDIPFTISGKIANSKGEGVDGVTVTATGVGIATNTLTISPALAIPDNNATGVTSQIFVTQSEILRTAQVTVDIPHGWSGDLEIRLIHPDGTSVLLQPRSGSGGNSNLNLHNVTYNVPGLAGKPTLGVWKLNVQDLAAAQTGVLQTWSLTLGVDGTQTRSTVTAADGLYAITGIPAGSYTVSAGEEHAPGSLNVILGPDRVVNFRTVSIYHINEPIGVTATEVGRTATVRVTRTGDTDQSGSISYSAVSGTAVVGRDFSVTGSGSISFAAGQTSKTFAISIVDDNLLEGPEQATLRLTNAGSGGTVAADGTATLTITDDVAKPTPDSLRVLGSTANSVTLQWRNLCGNNTRFEVERVAPGGTVILNVGSANQTRFTDSGLPGGKTIRYRVRAVAGELRSNYSAAVTAVTGLGVQSVTVNKPVLRKSKSTKGRVTLTGPAAPAAVKVLLSVAPGNLIKIPKSVTIKRGSSSATFNIKAKSKKGVATITATLNGSVAHATVSVVK